MFRVFCTCCGPLILTGMSAHWGAYRWVFKVACPRSELRDVPAGGCPGVKCGHISMTVLSTLDLNWGIPAPRMGVTPSPPGHSFGHWWQQSSISEPLSAIALVLPSHPVPSQGGTERKLGQQEHIQPRLNQQQLESEPPARAPPAHEGKQQGSGTGSRRAEGTQVCRWPVNYGWGLRGGVPHPFPRSCALRRLT